MLPDYSKDEYLLLALKNGELTAFEYLYKNYKYWMLLEAFRYLKNDLAAQDLIQDILIEFWHNQQYKNITSNIKGYLLRMVRNRALNYVRDERRKGKKETNFLTIHLSVPEEQTESEEIKNWLTESIEKLPPKTRIVFVNFYLEGLSQKKIAEMLNISPNTVNNHVESARKFMRKHLKKLRGE